MNSRANFLRQVFWLMLQPEKRPSHFLNSGQKCFPSAITAEGAAADFNRVPFYRKICGRKNR
jgi:hypothetical protein